MIEFQSRQSRRALPNTYSNCIAVIHSHPEQVCGRTSVTSAESTIVRDSRFVSDRYILFAIDTYSLAYSRVSQDLPHRLNVIGYREASRSIEKHGEVRKISEMEPIGTSNLICSARHSPY